jgi:hypothetical protein
LLVVALLGLQRGRASLAALLEGTTSSREEPGPSGLLLFGTLQSTSGLVASQMIPVQDAGLAGESPGRHHAQRAGAFCVLAAARNYFRGRLRLSRAARRPLSAESPHRGTAYIAYAILSLGSRTCRACDRAYQRRTYTSSLSFGIDGQGEHLHFAPAEMESETLPAELVP